MVKKYSHIFLAVFLCNGIVAQAVKKLSLEDYDLKGNVKTCTVITDYGQERFEFDSTGTLIKIVTQYNKNDQDITQFTYKNGKLIEKRLESYKNGKLDTQTSMANFFEFDTLSSTKKITEKIISYDKAFFEEQEIYLNEDNRVERIVTSHENGVDEKKIEYADYKGEKTETTFLNGIIEESVRISKRKHRTGKEVTVNLRKDYVDGEPKKAIERQFDASGKLLSEEFFDYDTKEQQFVSLEKRSLVYDKDGILEKELLTRGKGTSEKAYIFQFDDNEQKNWVKKIITPGNLYTTRRIIYFKEDAVATDTID